MHERSRLPDHDLTEFYRELCLEMKGLREGHPVADFANAAALLFHHLREVNWAGFYFLEGSELVLGPFQGWVACTRIALGRGVCGQAAAQIRSLVVPDVDQFPGHIVCDSASRSEIVVPLIDPQGKLRGVLDVDSPKLARFSEKDREGLEQFVAILMEASR